MGCERCFRILALEPGHERVRGGLDTTASGRHFALVLGTTVGRSDQILNVGHLILTMFCSERTGVQTQRNQARYLRRHQTSIQRSASSKKCRRNSRHGRLKLERMRYLFFTGFINVSTTLFQVTITSSVIVLVTCCQ